MSMTKEALKKFVEEDYKDHAIMVTCDNEHVFFHNTQANIPLIWDWDNNVFISLEDNPNATSQGPNPMQIIMVSLDEIQFITAYVDTNTALDFINTRFKDEDAKNRAKAQLKLLNSAMMAPKTLREGYNTPRDEYLGVQK